MPPAVAAFTDTYLPTVNGVTYTVRTWCDRWRARGGHMDVVYPRSDHRPAGHEHPVSSVAFPFYDGFRIGAPSVPTGLNGVDVVHAHTPFGLGIGAYRLARSADAPLVTSYHTPTAEYAGYISEGQLASAVARCGNAYERWFLGRADRVVAPSESAKERLLDAGVDTPVTVITNGIDTDFFAPDGGDAFRDEHGLSGTLVGYTGRHGFEKRLTDVLDACDGLDVSVVLGGDGPARPDLEQRARDVDVDVRFLGFLDRADLPAFYSALDAFAFPSPVETEGLVAMEANACGTPVAAVDAGGLSATVVDGVTGYHYDEPGDVRGFRRAIERVLDDRERLRQNCLDRREQVSVERSVDALEAVYRDLG